MRRTYFCLWVSLLLFSISGLSYAKTLRVPSQHPTIQAAVNAAVNGDEIIVSPGTYKENIRILGKKISLHSTHPTSASVVAATVIDGRSSGSVVTFSGTEGSSCNLSGFTITKGKAPLGGGIFGNGTRATISNNRITTNTTTGGRNNGGGGIAKCHGMIRNNSIIGNFGADNGGGLYDCDGTVKENYFANNASFVSGGAAADCRARFTSNTMENNSNYSLGGALFQCSGAIENNIFRSNRAKYGGALHTCGGRIRNNLFERNSANEVGGALSACNGTIDQNRITSNTASFWGGGLAACNGSIRNNLVYMNLAGEEGGGLFGCDGAIQNNTIYGNRTYIHDYSFIRGGGLARCRGEIRNCIIWGNVSFRDPQISTSTLPTYSDIQDWNQGGTGNIFLDPKFENAAAGNFHLKQDSPCIDAGGSIPAIKIDFEGNPRPINVWPEPQGDGSDYDMGAYEFVPAKLYVAYWVYY